MAPMGLSKLVRVQEEARYALSVSLAKFDGRFADHKSWLDPKATSPTDAKISNLIPIDVNFDKS